MRAVGRPVRSDRRRRPHVRSGTARRQARRRPGRTPSPQPAPEVPSTGPCVGSRRSRSVRGTVPPTRTGPTLGVRVQAFGRRAPVADRAAVSQRPTESHTAAQADRPAGVRLRRDVLGGLRARGDLPGALGGRPGGLHDGTLDRGRRRGGDAHRGRLLPPERARLPLRRRRLRGGHHQPGADGRPDGGQRPARRLRAHRGGLRGGGDVQHRLGGSVHR